jgi:UDP-2-acetamido-3-amino-2,3-dideoxy-glucuronate N-acetyltransferase
MPRPHIACIGGGHWGRNLIRNFHQIGALAAICENYGARRAQLASEYPEVPLHARIDEILADASIRGVVIATPAESHAGLARAALLAGKDVFVEKPLALSIAEAEALVELAERNGRILMVGHLLWYHPAVLKLKELIDEGALGRIQYLYSNRLNLGKIRREENILWSFAPHDVSVILGLLGEMPESVEAHGGNFLHQGIADTTVSLLSFPSGKKGHIFVSWLHPVKEQKLIVVGDRKMAVFNDVEKDHKLVVYPHAIDWKHQVPVATRAEGETIALDWVEPLRAECQHFLECVETRATPRTDGREGLRVLRVLQSCQDRLEHRPRPEAKPLVPVPAIFPAPPVNYQAHETACIDEGCEVGEGTTIWHFSHLLRNTRVGQRCRIGQNVVIGPNVEVGDGVKIQNNVSVYEGVTLEDDVFCGPSMVFTNVHNPRSEIRRMDELRATLVRRGASLGANCTIVCGITIGRYAFVGAGAVVTRDVPDHALVVGNPGRLIGWMCVCGNRIHFSEQDGIGACKECEKQYIKEGMAVAAVSEEMATA